MHDIPEEPAPLTRRSLTRGAAWSMPVIALSTAAPALAASPACAPSLSFSGGLYYNFGTIYDRGTTNRTDQLLTLGGQTYVDDLPKGVTVTAITYNFWLENRQGQQSSGPGAFWMGNSTASTSGSCSNGRCSASWSPTSGSGFSSTVTNTANNRATVYPDGVSTPSWDVNMTWSAANDRVGIYSTSANGCRAFTTGPSSRFSVSYSGVIALNTADVSAGKKSIRSFSVVTATLSDGQTLRRTYLLTYTN